MDIYDSQSTEGHPRASWQLPTHQLHNVSNLIITLLHIVLGWGGRSAHRSHDDGIVME